MSIENKESTETLIKEEVEKVFRGQFNQNMGFSKLRIFSYDGQGQAEKIKLKFDPLISA